MASSLEKIFRLAHNLKGSALAVGFENIGHFTHELETMLVKLKDGRFEINGGMSEIEASTVEISTPSHFLGVMNLRGQVTSVIDIRSKFRLNGIKNTSETAIILADLPPFTLGVVVDSISSVLALRKSEPSRAFR